MVGGPGGVVVIAGTNVTRGGISSVEVAFEVEVEVTEEGAPAVFTINGRSVLMFV
jgi:hypothetical protein